MKRAACTQVPNFQCVYLFGLICSLHNCQAKRTHAPCATVGPDEPHAASTTWPDGVVDRQDLDILYPQFDKIELEAFLNSKLPSHPKLHRGQLNNGLRYLILPNKVPPNRYSSST